VAEFSKQNSRRRPASNCTIRRQFAWINPHLTLSLEWGQDGAIGADKWTAPAANPTWEKWGPSDPTSPHWYDVPRLARLIGANIARAQDHHEPVKTVRNFVAEFRGL
jgi:hypothetical protein